MKSATLNNLCDFSRRNLGQFTHQLGEYFQRRQANQARIRNLFISRQPVINVKLDGVSQICKRLFVCLPLDMAPLKRRAVAKKTVFVLFNDDR
jgi:hypothetical protein